jgi:hypothetical protein
VALLALVNHVVKFDFQALLSFDRLQARITSTKSRRFIQVAANGVQAVIRRRWRMQNLLETHVSVLPPTLCRCRTRLNR